MANKQTPAIPINPDREVEVDNLLSLLNKHRNKALADSEFDTYEKVDGSYVWRAASVGIKRALRQLRELSEISQNELVLMHTPSGKVIARLNSFQTD
jgi:hypothetical protein